jgi:hypothetical protein
VAVGLVEAEARVGVLHEADGELAVDDLEVVDDAGLLGDDVLPVVGLGLVDGGDGDAVARGFVVRADNQVLAERVGAGQGFEADGDGAKLRFAGLADVEVVLGPTPGDGEELVAVVAGVAHVGHDFLRLAVAPNLGVALPVGAEFVVVDMAEVIFVAGRDGVGLGVARVGEAAGVGVPGDAAVAGVGDDEVEVLAGFHVPQVERALLGAAGGLAVGEQGAVG